MKKIKFHKPPTYREYVEHLNKKNLAYTIEERDGYKCIRSNKSLYKFKNDLCVSISSPSKHVELSYNEDRQVTEYNIKSFEIGYGFDIESKKVRTIQYDECNRVSELKEIEESHVNSDGCYTRVDTYMVGKFKYHEGEGFSVEICKSCKEFYEDGDTSKSESLKTYICDKDGNVIRELDTKQPKTQKVVLNQCSR